MRSAVIHEFGGAWTEIKLDAIERYLGFFTRVLSGQPFNLHYVDAFAGSGTRTAIAVTGGLLEDAPIAHEKVELAGSVTRALAVEPGFQSYTFIEGNRARLQGLAAIQAEHPSKMISLCPGETNQVLASLFSGKAWQPGTRNRAVVFLDPYGMNVMWETLTLLAQTRAADVWYLFPLEGVSRQLAGVIDRIDKHKSASLDRIFGTADWREDLYTTQVQYSLLDNLETTATRNVSKAQIEAYARGRLGTLFRYVSEPLQLLAEGRGQLFSLLCLSNSASDPAINLIKKGVKYAMQRPGQASRRSAAP